MANLPDDCPKCGGQMEQGFLLDNAHGGGRLVIRWVKGPPEQSFWMGTRVPKDGMIPVGTFRCDRCGFLESYARDEFAAR